MTRKSELLWANAINNCEGKLLFCINVWHLKRVCFFSTVVEKFKKQIFVSMGIFWCIFSIIPMVFYGISEKIKKDTFILN